jgi:hypothetical protein
MKFKFPLFLVFFFGVAQTYAQWSVQPGIGISNPITGYKTIVNSGVLYQMDGTKRLKNNRWGIGLMLGWARMQDDNNTSDKFQNARLQQIPILISADYEFLNKKLIPYAGLGLGVSLYNLNYETAPGFGETIFNVSFSAMPRLGLRLNLESNIFPFFEVNCPMVMDGPPIGAGESDKATGYVGVAVGAAYRFK